MIGPDHVVDVPQWRPHPAAGRLVEDICGEFCRRSAAARDLRNSLYRETGTRLIDWVDHFAVSGDAEIESRLDAVGFARSLVGDRVVWHHAGGLFPDVEIARDNVSRAAIKVDSVEDFLAAGRSRGQTPIEGAPHGRFRKAQVASENGTELWVVERHGYQGWDAPHATPEEIDAACRHAERLRRRKRDFDEEDAGFEHAGSLIDGAIGELDVDRACDLFFAAEREYWAARNRAARLQKARQDKLGLGWANHDHHTYRSSRSRFATLIGTLERLGLACRERFYAGRAAGWGAQVMEQPQAGIVVFADVDLDPEEVAGDFAHEPLPPSRRLGTVGLWCRLHGEALLQAGMHHLECRFDFEAARSQLRAAGIGQMDPFTDLAYLKQAFTEGEKWTVDLQRIDSLLADGHITAAEADHFRRHGAIGSHLEILQRDDGYRGFNQEGINEIIRETDPRLR